MIQLYHQTSENCFAFDSNTGTITDYYDYEQNNSSNPACPRDVVIPKMINNVKVTTIGERAFNATGFSTSNKLTSVVIPNTVTTILTYAFSNNYLTSVTIPNSITSIGTYAFSSNRIESLVIPTSITVIERNAFASNKLTSLTLHDGITSIGDYAFAYNRMADITIPKTVVTISSGAFMQDTGNKWNTVTIKYNNTNPANRFDSQKSIIGWGSANMNYVYEE